MKKLQKKLFLSVLMVIMGTGLMAQDRMYRDLEGISGRSGESALEQKGYTHIKTNKGGEFIYSYWWNNSSKTCICEQVTDGKVLYITKASSSDCNKSSEGYAERHNAYEHTVMDHQNHQHYRDSNLENSFERGFLDGLHNKSYHNVYTGDKMIEAYAWGYSAGAEKREKMTTHHAKAGGYADKDFVEWKDLIRKDASQSYETLKARGFRDIHTSTYNGATHKYFHNKTTGQCIETEQRGRIILNIKHYTQCNQFMD